MTAPDPRLAEIEMEAVEAAARIHCDRGESYWGDWTEEAKAEALQDMRAALEAAAPHMNAYLLAELRKRDDALARVEQVRKELFEFSKDSSLAIGQCAAYRDASRAIHIALAPAAAATGGGES